MAEATMTEYEGQVGQEEMADDLEADLTFIDIARLQDVGISVAEITKLKQASFMTVGSVLAATRKTLLNVKGLSDAKVDKILEACEKLDDRGSFQTGSVVLARRNAIVHVSTGSSALDALLGGGIESASITEVYGEFRTGKTQLCHTLCVTTQLPREMGGGNGKVAYIDTEGTFRPERVAPIAERYGLDPESVLDNVLYARALNSDQQAKLVIELAAHFAEDHFKLVIIDSITSLFRVDYSGRGELADRQQKLARMLACLIKLAEEFNVAVFISNQVVADPGNTMAFGPTSKPIGGHILGHASTTRLALRKGRGDERIAKIADSPCLPEAEATFRISDQGISDAV
jgi:meiotic recombination protein DMC1